MASLHKDPRSPYWQLQYKDGNGKRKIKSTGYRWDDPVQTKEARIARASAEAKELAVDRVSANGAAFDTWVPDFLVRHSKRASTLNRYQGRWAWLVMWMQESKVKGPEQITYQRALDYLKWRTEYVHPRTKKKCCRNTAVYDIRLLQLVMGEAVRMGHVAANPLASLRIAKEPVKKKREITPDEICKIQKHLAKRKEWMRTSFQIALHTGCRLFETAIQLKYVDFAEKRLTFIDPKGGETRAFSIPLPPALEPIFKDLQAKGRATSLELPPLASRQWQRFFDQIGMPDVTFHCIRVTFINQLRRAGIPREVAMRLVNHASDTVHQIYQRETVDDLRAWASKIPPLG
jgi:integrase